MGSCVQTPRPDSVTTSECPIRLPDVSDRQAFHRFRDGSLGRVCRIDFPPARSGCESHEESQNYGLMAARSPNKRSARYVQGVRSPRRVASATPNYCSTTDPEPLPGALLDPFMLPEPLPEDDPEVENEDEPLDLLPDDPLLEEPLVDPDIDPLPDWDSGADPLPEPEALVAAEPLFAV